MRAAARARAILRTDMKNGDPDSCDTFSSAR